MIRMKVCRPLTSRCPAIPRLPLDYLEGAVIPAVVDGDGGSTDEGDSGAKANLSPMFACSHEKRKGDLTRMSP
jgi:hypothetical protein